MASYYTDLNYMGRAFRISIYDYIERYGPRYGEFVREYTFTIPGRWHLDVEIDPRTPRKIGEKIYKDVATAVMMRRSGDVNPHFNDLGAAKRQVRDAIRKLIRNHPKRWGIVAWDGEWHRQEERGEAR